MHVTEDSPHENRPQGTALHHRSAARASSLAAWCVALCIAAAGCGAPAQRPLPEPPVVEAPGPLPRTGLALDAVLAGLSGGATADGAVIGDPAAAARPAAAGVDAASLASLRITRSAVEHLEQREPQRALDLLERAIAIDGDNGFAYLYIGYIHLEDGRPDRALPFIERGAMLMPDEPALQKEVRALRLAAKMEDASVSGSRP